MLRQHLRHVVGTCRRSLPAGRRTRSLRALLASPTINQRHKAVVLHHHHQHQYQHVPQHQRLQRPKRVIHGRWSTQTRQHQLCKVHSRFYSTETPTVGEDLIPTVNKLQEIFAMTGTQLDLPQIVVVGGQSSGKSSVLENLVGKDFLPRGSGIVTRRPLILQLHTLPPGEKEYGEFLHKPGQTFTDFREIKNEIEADTERIAGKNKGVSNTPILLRVYSPHVLPLTLVDTPGMARVAIGDQPSNIEEQIKTLVSEYIFKPNSIILAVQAANQDIATSDALHLAKLADTDGSRTIGVLTKLDLMDKGTDAMAVLLGRSFPLRRGWTAIVNRSQQDIDADIPITLSQKKELDFFREHATYRTIAERCGTAVLAQKCNSILSEHIRKTLPDIRRQIDALIRQREGELELYGEPIGDDDVSKDWLLLQLLNKFTQQFREAIEGGVSDPDASKVALSGGARIRYIFHDSFTRKLNEVNPTIGLTSRDIQAAIKNAAGSKSALFVPDKAFEILAQRQIKWLREPSLQAAELVHNELLKIIADLENKDLMRFWRLRDKVLEVSTEMLRKMLKETQQMINTTIDLELTYINTSHPDFIGLKLLLNKDAVDTPPTKEENLEEEHAKSQAAAAAGGGGFFSFLFRSAPKNEPAPRPKQDPGAVSYDEVLNQVTDREKAQIRIIRKLLDSYFTIVKKNVQDRTTKIIMMKLVKNSIGTLQKALVGQIYRGEGVNIQSLLVEAGDVAMKRKVCQQELEALRKAKKVVQMNETAFHNN